jgi:V8-like Glu-specific endopeptidase
MKRLYTIFLVVSFCCKSLIFAQISHGGSPLFLGGSSLRSSNELEFIEMPSFDLDSVLQSDDLNSRDMRSSYQFAYKFYTHLEKGLQGSSQLLPDGTKVWRIGIHSEGAYSINLLFTKFHLPEGGKLFIYNADYTHVIGSFTHQNNSPNAILPVRPVAGDSIIVEYSEPAHTTFEGELVIGEVNHDYRNILKSEPGSDNGTQYLCMPDVLCEEVDDIIIRSTVLLMINGNTLCTGSLVNNTKNDETPYILTAVHCLNKPIPTHEEFDYYVAAAGTVVAFFNYNRPVCNFNANGANINMKATEEMSMAVTSPKVIIEGKDVALLKLNEKPPVHYNAYYAGWNMDEKRDGKPFTNIHHPQGSVKKYGLYQNNLTLGTLTGYNFDTNAHWVVNAWNIGSTYGGSSGSPLFDKNKWIIGTLSGGNSLCNGSNPNGATDLFAAIYKSWEQTDTNNQLKTYLDPINTGKKQQEGYDPHKNNPVVRVSNADYTAGDKLINTPLAAPNTGFLFGNSNLNTTEFAEEFNLTQSGKILGVYLLIPAMNFAATSGVEIEIYGDVNSPETLLARKPFRPQYLNYSGGNFTPINKTLSSPSESFVLFDNPVSVGKKFFVAYKINPLASAGSYFSVYNTEFSSPGKPNTAWLKTGSQWIKASGYEIFPSTTSLALQPLIRYTTGNAIKDIDNRKKEFFHYDRISQQLSFSTETRESGAVFVYSVTGQLLDYIPFSEGDKYVQLTAGMKGTIGIVKVKYKSEIHSGKIIY